MRYLQILLTLLGTSGILLPFLPFAYDVVPIRDVWWDLFWLGAMPGIVLPLPISLTYFLWCGGHLPGWAKATGYVLAAISSAPVLVWMLSPGSSAEFYLPEFAYPSLFVLGTAGSAWFAVRAGRDGLAPPGAVAMQAVYLTPMAMWLGAYLRSGDIGAKLAIVTIAAYTVQLALAVRVRSQLLVVLLPAAGMFAVAWRYG